MSDMKVKGRYFATAPDGDEVRIRWSDKTADESKWDPLDFWNVAPDEVDATIAKLRDGFTL